MIKDQAKLDKHIQLVNCIITLVNDLEFMMENQISSDVIDKLILARFYSQIFPLYRPEDKINIKQIVRNIDDNITTPKETVMGEIASFLFCKEIDYELTQTNPNLKEVTSKEEYMGMLDDLVEQIKSHIEWN